jgi:hypothetical protein
MVRAFLRAEIDSPRFQDGQGLRLRDQIRQVGLDPRSLIDTADLGDTRANALRREILRQWRGYCDAKSMFAGMPDDVTWRRVRLQPDEIGSLLYCNHPTWIALAVSGRSVADGAANINKVVAPDNVNAHITQVADRVRRGEKFPELILVQTLDGQLILLEGHTRATAYLIAPIRGPIDAFVGSSLQIGQWAFHG